MKTRRCSLCRKKVPAESAVIGSLKAFCCMEHLIEYSRSASAQQLVKKARKTETRKMKEYQLTRRDYEKIAQTAFNAYIRARDHGLPCISCGGYPVAADLGGTFDCGHYRSVGSSRHLRFHVWNAHGQCKKCNRHLSGNVVAYRAGLVRRIGQEKVDKIEADQRNRKYTIDDLKRIATLARKRTKRYVGQ